MCVVDFRYVAFLGLDNGSGACGCCTRRVSWLFFRCHRRAVWLGGFPACRGPKVRMGTLLWVCWLLRGFAVFAWRRYLFVDVAYRRVGFVGATSVGTVNRGDLLCRDAFRYGPIRRNFQRVVRVSFQRGRLLELLELFRCQGLCQDHLDGEGERTWDRRWCRYCWCLFRGCFVFCLFLPAAVGRRTHRGSTRFGVWLGVDCVRVRFFVSKI